MPVLDLLLLLGVGMLAGGLLRWSLPILLREPPEVRALRAWAQRHGWRCQEEGEVFRVVGGLQGRALSLTLLPGPPLQLLVGVDCAAAEQRGVQEGTLVSRWTFPPAGLLEEQQLDILIEELVGIAESLEEQAPAPPPDDI